MDRCALFVDAGYALADGAMAVHGTRRRDSVSWDHAGLLKLLAGLARDRTGLPVLRCYWYETAAEGRRTAEHDALAEMPGLKLRLVNALPGRREGIESQLRRDLVTLAKSGAITDAFIASANEHIAEIVAEVQDLGLRVVILHIASDGGWTIPLPLRQECDDIVEISGVHLRSFVDLIKGAEPVATEDQYPAGAFAARGSQDAKNTMVGALTHQGLPAAALPAAGSAYQVPDSRDPRQDGPAYAGQSAMQPSPYQQDMSPQPQYFGAPTGGASTAGPAQPGRSAAPAQAQEPSGLAAPADGQTSAGSAAYPVSTGYDSGPARPAQIPGQPTPSQAMPVSGYQNGTTGIYQNAPGVGYPGSNGQIGADQVGPGQQATGQHGIPQQGASPQGPSQHGTAQHAVPQHGGAQQGQVQGNINQAMPGQNATQGPGANQTGPIAGDSGPNGLRPNGTVQNGASPNGGPQQAAGQNGYSADRGLSAIPATGFPATSYQRGPGQNGTGSNGTDHLGQGAPGQQGYPGQAQNGPPPQTAGQNGSGQFSYQPGQAAGPGNAPGSYGSLTPDQSTGQHSGPQAGYQPSPPPQPSYPAQAAPAPPPQPGHPGSHTQSYQFPPSQAGGQPQPSAQPGQNQPGQNQPGQNQPGQNQPGQNQPGQLPGGPGYQMGQNGSAQAAMSRPPQAHPPQAQQTGVFQSGQVMPEARPRDPYGPGVSSAPPGPPGFDAGPLPFAGPSGFGQQDGGFGPGQPGPGGADQGQRTSFGQSQAQGVGALMQPQLTSQQALVPQQAMRVQQPVAIALPDAVKAAHAEGYNFGESVGREAPGLWLEAVLARKPRMPSDLEARLLQGSVLPIDSLLHDEVRHSLRRGFWDALESTRR